MIKNKIPFLVAEISANHCGNINLAKKLIKCAKDNGADAAKLQTYTADTMTIQSNKKYFKIKNGLWKGYDLWNLYNEAHTPLEWNKKLFDYGKKLGITIFSTPFDETAVNLLEKLKCPMYKVASFEMTDLLLIKKISQKIIILASIVFSALFLVLYFGQTDRASGVGGEGIGSGYFQYFLYSSNPYISSYFIPVILFLLFIIFRRKLFNFKISKQSSNERFLFFIIFTCILTLILTLRTSGYSDTYYQLISFYWFIFFFLITPQFKALFFSSKDQQIFFQNPIFKFFIVFLIFMVSVGFFKKHFIIK